MSYDVKNELKKSREYRKAFVAAHVRNGIAFQLRAMRDARRWDQKEVARRLGNTRLQPVISRYENPDYGKFSVSTLLELAAAFDVALIVRFAPFREVIRWESGLSETSLNVPSFDEESGPVSVLRTAQISLLGYVSKDLQSISTFFTGNTGIPTVTIDQFETQPALLPSVVTTRGEGRTSCQPTLA